MNLIKYKNICSLFMVLEVNQIDDAGNVILNPNDNKLISALERLDDLERKYNQLLQRVSVK